MRQATPTQPTTFGELLRFLRHRMQLTQQQLGIALGYSAAMIARLEGDDRLPDLALVKTAYVEALGLEREPELAAQLVALAERARGDGARGDGHATAPSPAQFGDALRARSNLPRQLTPFIGRAGELAEVARLLTDHPLVTLTGAGGVGKTRLALEAARALLPDFPDGVQLAELAPLSDPPLVPLAAARVFRLPEDADRDPAEALATFLARRRALLVLDNCEHLAGASAALADALLRACPELKILATSREPLRVPGEVTWRVPSMEAKEAAQLFVCHAQSALPGFAVTEQNAATVDGICRHLDGIPLAIELAAAQVRALSVDQIAARLGDRLRLLTGGARTALPRQQTLRATLDWSYALLSEPERALFARLAVFAGGWTLEAAEAVCGPDLLPLLRSLVDKSLVVAESHAEAMRYRLLETLRQYAQERLAEAGQVEALRDRHLAWCVAFAERANAELLLSKYQPWKARVQAEQDNLRAAQEWCWSNAAEPARADAWMRIVIAMSPYWGVSGFGREHRQWLQRLWDSAAWRRVTQPAACTTVLQAQALYSLWVIPVLHRTGHPPVEPAEMAELADACLARCRAAGDRQSVGYILLVQSMLAELRQDDAGARALALEGLSVFEEQRDLMGLYGLVYHLPPIYRRLNAHAELADLLERHIQRIQQDREWDTGWYVGELPCYLADEMVWLGKRERAAAYGEQFLATTEAWDDPIGSWQALSIVAIASPSRALVLAEQWLARQRQLGDEESIAMALHRLGVTLIDNGGYERSFTVLDECAARFRALGDVPTWGGLAQTLMYRSIASRFLGDYRQALADLDEGDRMSRAWQSSPVWLGAAINYHRGLVLLEMGDLAAATTALKASLQEFRERGAALYHVPLLLASLSEAAQAGGQSLKAARLAGAAAAHAGRASNQDACLLHPCERALAAARARLGDPALAAAWAEGQAMGWDQAIDCALAV